MFLKMDMKRYIQVLMVMMAITIVSGILADESLIINPVAPGLDAPVCTSYSSVCHMANNITQMGMSQVLHSYSQICRCPEGLKCHTNWFDKKHSIVRAFKNAGEEMQVKLSYCKLSPPTQKCTQNEPAVVMRGRGPFLLEIHGDFKCKCSRPLYAHQSWMDGPYNYVEYSCGKPRCNTNRHPENHCSKVTYIDEGYYHDEYLCRCKRNEECIGGAMPTSSKVTAYRHCQSVYYNDARRRKLRQNRAKAPNKTRRATKT